MPRDKYFFLIFIRDLFSKNPEWREHNFISTYEMIIVILSKSVVQKKKFEYPNVSTISFVTIYTDFSIKTALIIAAITAGNTTRGESGLAP